MHNVLRDIVTMLDRAHRYGDLKRRIVAAPERFIERRPELGEMIARFRAAGTSTFVLTNSGYEYTVDVLEYLFPNVSDRPGWQTVFDAVVVDADKPSYFRSETATPAVSLAAAGAACAAVWRAGVAADLERFFRPPPGRILYIGDNPAADCVPAAARGWRTALVIPELDTDAFPYGPGPRPAGADDGWGSVFVDSGRRTRFARVLGESADVFASRVDWILSRRPDTSFRARCEGPF